MKNNKLHKALHWEYWPAAFFYVPNLPFAFYLAAKAKHTAFFSAANPSIKSSGNGTESKSKTMQLVPMKYRPISVLHKAKCAISVTLNALKKENIQFPLIVKPDIGYRGLLVQKIHTEIELKKKPSIIPNLCKGDHDQNESYQCKKCLARIGNVDRGSIEM